MPIHVELVTQERKVFEEAQADIVILPRAGFDHADVWRNGRPQG
jgi:hypothetical protein